MTVCFGAICDEGREKEGILPKVLLASDRMITAEDIEIEFEHPKPKFTMVSPNCAIATAGDALIHAELIDRVKEEAKKIGPSPLISDIVKIIKDIYTDLRDEEIISCVLNRKGIHSFKMLYELHHSISPEILRRIHDEIDKYEYDLEILIGGVDRKGAHLFWIDDPGVVRRFDELGYYGIGSGEAHAERTFVAEDYVTTFSFEKTLYILYKAKKISQKAPGVGKKYIDFLVIGMHPSGGLISGPIKDDTIELMDRMYQAEKESTKIDYEELKRRVEVGEVVEADRSYA